MNKIKILLAIFVLVCPSLVFAQHAIVCNNCPSPKAAAEEAKIPGIVTVSDFSQWRLYQFSVQRDFRSNRWIASSSALAPETIDLFNWHVARLRSMSLGRFITEPKGKKGVKGASGPTDIIVIDLSPGGNSPTGPGGISLLPAGYSSANAYLMTQDQQLRNNFEIALARNYAHGNSSNPTVNSTNMSWTRLVTSLFGGDKIIVIWKDSSRNVFEITSTTLDRARYKPGESLDSNNNKVPDSTVGTDPGSYAGYYEFKNGQDVIDFANGMRLNGGEVNVGSPSNAPASGNCQVRGDTAKCDLK